MNRHLTKGRGAGYSPPNKFQQSELVQEFIEGLDEEILTEKPATKFIEVQVKNPLSKNDSPDLLLNYSVNPYQGCEHGCIYCYARNSHQYWGYDSGLGFETTILVKKDIVQTLKKTFECISYKPQVILLSGNTDCYQPAERTYRLTRGILEACLAYRHPVSIITKNVLIKRDMDLLVELAKHRLVHVYFSINHLDPSLKSMLEPRTASAAKKLTLLADFSAHGIPCGIMVAPIIPGINLQDMTSIVQQSADAGALKAGYTVVRLNGQLGDLFRDWLERYFPDRASKVLNQIQSLHGGSLNDANWGRRMKGEGTMAELIRQMFQAASTKYLSNRTMPDYDFSAFRGNGQLSLFPS
ncbi:MAG: PA0069 family radical SAM protein [Lunatimonas sp.]|uniref:PA0069 family radical SAM protein n=1 Tax=Lunatimonas sp. TaxID=2060141 RepID=UPI00263A426F|nr:PA0069 family radical SAM protein [Lunatimonas sp.]MCC5938889.1 PA0069 family radical SAM protein [Lunatimonas sp.]